MTYSAVLDRSNNSKLRKEHYSKVTLVVILAFVVAFPAIITLLIKLVVIDVKSLHMDLHHQVKSGSLY